MGNAAAELTTPVLLTAMPQVLDPFFHRSVVLLLHHDEEASFGVIVNRPTEIHVADVLKGLEIEWRGRLDTLAFFGGPVQPQLGTVLYQPSESAEPVTDKEHAVLDTLRLTQDAEQLAVLAAAPPMRFRFYLGYAGWGSGQLYEEILRNDWLTAEPSNELIFAEKPTAVWNDALRSAGIDPTTLPAWSPEPATETN